MLIGLSGKKRSGKDTAAGALVTRRGFVRTAFADPLKDVLKATDPCVHLTTRDRAIMAEESGLLIPAYARLADLVDVMGWEVAKEARDVRRLLQAHGHGMRTHVDPDVWVTAARRRVRALMDDHQHVVISDVRYPDEFAMVQELGGFNIRVVRPGLESGDEHVTETALDSYVFDSVILNNGSTFDLRVEAVSQIDTLARRLG